MFNNIEVPIFVSFGTDGEYLLQSLEVVHQILEQKKSNKTSLTYNVIDGASHVYEGKESILATKILEWIKKLHG
jgi:alpha/beta superfamily hydrolase